MMNEIHERLKQQRFRLSHHVWQKRHFDPTKHDDISEFKYFLDNHRWQDRCPFILEWPHLSITDMIKTRLIDEHIHRMLKVEQKAK
jgi:hypothetical protein